MSKLLRHYSPGQVYFITAVTYRRAPLLVEHFHTLMESVSRVQDRIRFEVGSWVVLPNHFHMIVDPKDNDLSGIVRRLKLSFANLYRIQQGMNRGTIWQPRFWDHIIRDQVDMNRHIDYIHYNPVKHGFVSDPFRWRYSSLDRYHKNGYYARDWGMNELLWTDGAFGE